METPSIDSDIVEKSATPPQQIQYLATNTHYYGKYKNLYLFLLDNEQSIVELSFNELEKILGFALPRSAAVYSAWWSGHNHCYAWKDAGYEVQNIRDCVLMKIVTFVKY